MSARQGLHDPDLALHQPFNPRRVAILAFGATTALNGVAILFLFWAAGRHYEKHLRIVPAVLEDAKLVSRSSRCVDGLDPLEKTLVEGFEGLIEGHANGFATAFLQELLGEKDLVLQKNEDVLKFLKDWIADESWCSEKRKSASSILSDFLSDEDKVENPRGGLRSWLRQSLVPLNLDSREARGFFASPYEGSNAEQTSIALELRQKPELETLLYALYEKMREQLMAHRRIRARLVGLIQFATFGLFFFALILLRGRRLLLEEQNSPAGEFRRHLQLPKPAAGSAPWAQAIPVLAGTSRESLQALSDSVGQFRPKNGARHLFVPGVLYRVLRVLHESEDRGPRQNAREVLRATIERGEGRLERVEYSAISFAAYAMPTLGFIGTVLGIGSALGSADQVVRASDALQQANAISAVTSVLGVAFDTTLVALVCSLPITLLMSWIRSKESRFLLETQQLITTRLFQTGAGESP